MNHPLERGINFILFQDGLSGIVTTMVPPPPVPPDSAIASSAALTSAAVSVVATVARALTALAATIPCRKFDFLGSRYRSASIFKAKVEP